MLTKIKNSFEEESLQTQYSVLGYILYFLNYKLVTEIVEKDHSDRNIGYRTKTNRKK